RVALGCKCGGFVLAWWRGVRSGVGGRVWAFLVAAGFRAAARRRVKLERPQPLAPVRALARTNELDARKRGPMIESEESPPGCGLPWAGGSLGGIGFPGVGA